MGPWLSADGKILVTATKKPFICEDCPCGCPECASLTLVISGVSPCSCTLAGFIYQTLSVFTGVNGTHSVPSTGPGVWQLTGVGAWTKDDYSDSGCTTLVTTTAGTYTISISCTDGSFNIGVEADDTSHQVFGATGLIDDMFNNTIMVCAGTDMGTGGSATLECVP